MEQIEIMSAILDSWNKPVVFVDTNHIIAYMNSTAQKHYTKYGDVLGKSIFHCHNEKSCQIIRETFPRLVGGEHEVLIVDNKKHRVYMRSVRDGEGKLIGYFERYEARLTRQMMQILYLYDCLCIPIHVRIPLFELRFKDVSRD